jgi:phage gp36-like protein
MSDDIAAQREELRESFTPLTIENLTDKVAKDSLNKKLRNKAIFDATKLNPSELKGTRSIGSQQNMMSGKIGSWLE